MRDLAACQGKWHLHAAVHKLRKLRRESVRRRVAGSQMTRKQADEPSNGPAAVGSSCLRREWRSRQRGGTQLRDSLSRLAYRGNDNLTGGAPCYF